MGKFGFSIHSTYRRHLSFVSRLSFMSTDEFKKLLINARLKGTATGNVNLTLDSKAETYLSTGIFITFQIGLAKKNL